MSTPAARADRRRRARRRPLRRDAARERLRRRAPNRRRRGRSAVRAAGALEGAPRGLARRRVARAAAAVVLGRARNRAVCSAGASSASIPRRRTALTDRGEELTWDALVLATGARHAITPRLERLRRTCAANARRRGRRCARSCVPGTRVAIVGAGFVGTEVASTALSLGASVTLVDWRSAPLERVLGAEVGSLLAGRYAEAGVELRLGSSRRTQSSSTPTWSSWRSESRPRPLQLAGVERDPDRRLRPHCDPGRLRRGRRRRGLASAARPAAARRALDERRRPGCSGRARNPRRGAPARCAAVLLVGPVRPSAPVRRPRRVVGRPWSSRASPARSSRATATSTA